MICKRCGSRCPPHEGGYCFHCLVSTDLEKALGKSLKDAGIAEGFPDWEKPRRGDTKQEIKERDGSD